MKKAWKNLPSEAASHLRSAKTQSGWRLTVLMKILCALILGNSFYVQACISLPFGSGLAQCGTPKNPSRNTCNILYASAAFVSTGVFFDHIWTPEGLHRNKKKGIYPHSLRARIQQTLRIAELVPEKPSTSFKGLSWSTPSPNWFPSVP